MSNDHTPEGPVGKPRRLLSKREVLALVPVSYTTLWSWMRQGQFPRSIVLGPGSKVGWYEDSIAEWLASREPSQLKPLPAEVAA